MRKIKIIVWKVLMGRDLNGSEVKAKLDGLLEGLIKFQGGQVALTPLGYRVALDFANSEGLPTTQLQKVS